MKLVDDEGNTNWKWYFIGLPIILVIASVHFIYCSLLTIFVHPKKKRYEWYEYYAPWGWGTKTNTPED